MGETTARPTKVKVTDISMSMWSMMIFMIKWAIVAIPAIIILALLTAGAVLFLTCWLGDDILYRMMMSYRDRDWETTPI